MSQPPCGHSTHAGESRKRFTMAVTEDGRMLAMNGEDPYLNAVPVDADMMGYSLEARGEKRTTDEEVRYIATACNDRLPVLVARGGGVSVELRHAPGHHAFVFDRTFPDVEGTIARKR